MFLSKKMKLIRPEDGTKIVIEGPYSKSGKTFLAAFFTKFSLDKHANYRGYGNITINHPHYKKVETLEPSDFKPKYKYIVVIDELDIKYPYQKSYYNEGLLAFWGMGASHHRAAIIATIQREYAELEKKYLRHYHIIAQRTLVNSHTDLPFAVTGRFIKPYQFHFTQNVELALGIYDPWESDVSRINFENFAINLGKIKGESPGKNGPKSMLRCFRCHHSWKPIVDQPKQCPGCGWQPPRKWKDRRKGPPINIDNVPPEIVEKIRVELIKKGEL
jgi:hypothetical protein